MGMAASQARYLALVARKSNCEYQGQQINQARTALSNQSANLFNQMLGLTVPIPPSVQDFTKAQYSFTDGTNTVTMDDWKQLATPEEDFNYVVTYHYESDIYTGSQKKMNDPQVQLNTKGNATSSDELKLMAKVLADAKLDYDNAIENQEKAKAKLDEIKSKHTAAMLQLQTDKANLVAMQTKKGELEDSRKDVKTFQNTSLYAKTKDCVQEGNNYKVTKANGVEATYVPYNDCAADIKAALDDEYKILTTDNNVTLAKTDLYYNKEDGTIAIKSDLENNLGTKGAARVNDLPVMSTSGLNTIGTISQSINTQIASLNEQIPATQKKITDVDEPLVATNEEAYLAEMGAYALVESEATLAQNKYEAAQAEYEQLQYPDFLGNCQLTRIDRLTENQSTEVRQVVSDMKAQGIDNASIGRCFDENGNYIGGIYSFKLNGTTYYTTIDDLYGSYESGLDFGNNQVDTQQKLSYYNAGYVKTKIEETKKALLETDSVGRFSSIRIEDDSITFALNMETITDDVAYQDAMNHYYYENAEYDKMIQDINAKTSIIQREDQQLELKLKQLDTEQNALSNEIDAVSKVVKDNVEKSFKTFGG